MHSVESASSPSHPGSAAAHAGAGSANPPLIKPDAGSRVLSTLNADGSRRWIKPRPSSGRFLSSRRAVAWMLIALFTLIPYISIGGKPMILLDLAARRFTLFGQTFLPTDTLLLALLLLTIGFTVFLVTALFGRVWCGWACPQTVYMEFLYRPIERLFEGTPGRAARSRLARSGAGKVLKYAAYFLISCFLAHTFLAYFVGVEALARWVRQSPFEHPTPFLVMAFVTGAMMFDFSYFREQTCILACPYGRLQSALLDRNSLIITYDRQRGEPRGKPASKSVPLPVAPPSSVGDCVDCLRCVTTCPTGIDIRNGLQMECIGCAQCIDACDDVMTRLKRPTGLIRYSSQNAVEHRAPRVFRARVAIYSVLLCAVASVLAILLANQHPAHITLLRGLGRPYTEVEPGLIANPIRVKIINRTDHDATYFFQTIDAITSVRAEVDPVVVAPGQSVTVPALIVAPSSAFRAGAFVARVRVAQLADPADASLPPSYSKDVAFRMLGPASAAMPAPASTPPRSPPSSPSPPASTPPNGAPR